MNEYQTQAGYSWAYGAVGALETQRTLASGITGESNRYGRYRIVGVETPADIALKSRSTYPSRK